MSQFFGKYRGTVANNLDPQMMGRVQVQVPAVLGEGRLSWALPCAPFAGDGVGFFAIPPIGANVWVEFEAGDPDYPIYSGGFWNLGEAPAQPAIPFVKVFKTDNLLLKLDDTPGAGGFTLEINPPSSATPLKITGGAGGLEISNGAAKIVLTPVAVQINDGALEVV
jgi:hypothetical protein